LPRLSILDNYRQISRIMTNSYIKSFDLDRRFKNSDPKSAAKDPEYSKYSEELQNTMKMSTILKQLNSPKKKRKAIQELQSRQNPSSANLSKVSLASMPQSKFALKPVVSGESRLNE
jgi:hypothetical protein